MVFKNLYALALLTTSLWAGSITVIDGVSYSAINSTYRQFRAYYAAGTPTTAALPIVVYVHGGEWSRGGRGDAKITPSSCTSDATIACWLADHGYVVYSIDYQLVTTVAAASDLMVMGTNQVMSASHQFTTADIGNNLLITPGGKWGGGGYIVQSVTNGMANLSTSPATVGMSKGAYTLLKAGTFWPAQWQDCNCFLRYLAENAGVTTPGNPNNVHLMGQSSGGHLALMMGMTGNNAFPTNCDHTSTNYTVLTVMAASPPSDLATLYPITNAKGAFRNLIGCIPTYSTCAAIAAAASPVTYVGQSLPFVATFSGSLDPTVPPSNAEEIQTAFANLNPPVVSPWTLFSGDYHPLDLYYLPSCTSLNEPSPCGSAGMFFTDAIGYIQQHSIP